MCGGAACYNGVCDSRTQKCKCDTGYGGSSCDKAICDPSLNSCNGKYIYIFVKEFVSGTFEIIPNGTKRINKSSV